MKKLAIIPLLLMLTLSSFGFEMNEDIRITMWNNESAPHSNNITAEPSETKPYRIANTTEAELFIYEADREKNTGKAIVICPGGGYRIVSMDNEGMLLAQWFAENGITAAVLKYRMPNGVFEVPFEDAVEALRIMRQRSRQLGYDPSQVGILGCSAGGHLAATVSAIAEVEQKPNFSVLFYPVISSDLIAQHKGSFDSLLGVDRNKELSEKYSIEKRIDSNTPPAILFHCSDDGVVPTVNSVRYYEELYKYNKQSALYIFPKGGHGWGNYDDKIDFQSIWQTLLLDWIDKLDKE